MTIIKIVDGKPYIADISELIKEYYQRLGRDLSFQNIDDELKNPAKKYIPPEGEILVAIIDNKVVGMVAYHRLTDTCCEMKSLYVKPECRGMKLGEKLIQNIISNSVKAGYREMVLDTIKPLKSAIYLYKKFGFVECKPYYNNPMDDVIYLKKTL